MGHQQQQPSHTHPHPPQPHHHHSDDRDCKRRRASDSDATPAAPHFSKAHSSTSPSSPASPTPTSPSSPLLAPSAPAAGSPSASSAAANGNSCHQCKTAKDASLLLFCTSAAEKGVRKRRCRKKYCESCLRRSYNPEVAIPCDNWSCPSCQGFCVCAACSRGVDGCEREGLTGAMAQLSQMNPLILALLGVDERKLAQLQAVINSPQLLAISDPSQAGLLASMIASSNGAAFPAAVAQPLLGPAALMAGMPAAALGGTPSFMGVNSVGLGMQELNLNHHYDAAAVLSQPATLLSVQPAAMHAYPPVEELRPVAAQPLLDAVAPLHSARSTASTVTSPYGSASAYSTSSSGTSSSASSPLLRSALPGQQQPTPPATISLLSLPPLPPQAHTVVGQPTTSPRLISRSYTHAQPLVGVECVGHVETSPVVQRQRLSSHPALPPLSSSTPSMSRILPQPSEHSPQLVLHDLTQHSHSYAPQPYQQPLSRKRSYSTTLADSEALEASRHRFVLPPHIVQQAALEYGRERAPSAAELNVKSEMAQYDTHWPHAQPPHQQPQPFALEHEMDMRKRLAEAAWKQEADAAYSQQPAHAHAEAELATHFDHPAHPTAHYPSSPPPY